MKEIIIDKNSAEQRIDKYLMKKFNLPPSLINKFLRKKSIKVNNGKVQNNYLLKSNDVIKLYLNDDLLNNESQNKYFLKSSSDIEVIYEDDNFLFISKPVGIPTHYSKNFSENLNDKVKKYLYDKNQSLINDDYFSTFSPLNRLDTNTTGLIVFAKNRPSMLFFRKMQKENKIHKFYLARIEGVLKNKSGKLENYYIKDSKNNKALIFDEQIKGSVKVLLEYKVISHNKSSSIVEVKLLTGKSHQIRAQFAHIGNPLVADTKYNAKHIKNNHQKLMAYKIEFDFIDQKEFSYLSNKTISIPLKKSLRFLEA